VERSVSSRTEQSPAQMSVVSRWARENPAAFAGLWFAAAAGLMATHLLRFLPGILVHAYSLGGTEAWTWGALGLGYVYVMPGLLALLVAMPLGRPIVARTEPHGWDAALRGALIGTGSFSVWLLMGPVLLRPLLSEPVRMVGVPMLSAWGAVGLLWLLAVHLLVACIGGWVGFLLHVFCRGKPKQLVVAASQAGRVEWRRES
jgi:hypothetical protein